MDLTVSDGRQRDTGAHIDVSPWTGTERLHDILCILLDFSAEQDKQKAKEREAAAGDTDDSDGAAASVEALKRVRATSNLETSSGALPSLTAPVAWCYASHSEHFADVGKNRKLFFFFFKIQIDI